MYSVQSRLMHKQTPILIPSLLRKAFLINFMVMQVSASPCVTVCVTASEVKRDGTLMPLTSTATLEFR